ncbi:LysR family transcriptional regulator [Octadecabacter sp. 1_MG-2023]|uniref:LysR family transcriptional regulator n=1 Tax=unclassified Octadecabacter TaxID=196158 RepID=UPI001C097571|nr:MULTISPECIES: LysR family transcriptional regulator [unclassified Octadecabacter]MBU2991590.1 LysR family transcriptional regulator [Octadecabacter sp. B2R22]MDO6736220.1 LysR family transcriptional regulator [Octadecabacter sp. 1_MG-2023]
MDNRRKNLPPLDTLIFFDAVIRAGGFTAASSELYVSQAAVSKRVRQLEDWLGTPLFERGTRSLTPTAAGQSLAEPVAMALDYLGASLDGLKSTARPAVRIAANNAVSMFWLFPRLKAFTFSATSCPVETVVTDDPSMLLSPENDLAIIYASAVPDGWVGQRLMEEELAPVTSPAGARQFARDPRSLPLLEYERHAPDWINWNIWAKRQSSSPLLDLPRVVCQTYGQSIGRAIAGEGIALASLTLLHEELASGSLEQLDAVPTSTGKGYFLVTSASGAKQDNVGALKKFLTN